VWRWIDSDGGGVARSYIRRTGIMSRETTARSECWQRRHSRRRRRCACSAIILGARDAVGCENGVGVHANQNVDVGDGGVEIEKRRHDAEVRKVNHDGVERMLKL
jgi:hypothetical protein